MKNKRAIIEEIGNPILNPMSLVGLVFMCMLAASPFVMIWGSFILGLKFLLTAVVGLAIVHFIMKVVREQIERNINEVEEAKKEDQPVKKSSFMEKLEKAMKDAESKRNTFAEKVNKIQNEE